MRIHEKVTLTVTKKEGSVEQEKVAVPADNFTSSYEVYKRERGQIAVMNRVSRRVG